MPDIFFKCGWCGKHLVADDVGVGLEITCPDCKKIVVIPKIRFAHECPQCKERVILAYTMRGEAFECPSCKYEIQVIGVSS